MGLAWDLARWAARKAEPYARSLLDWTADELRRYGETPHEAAARRAAESRAHIAKERSRKGDN